jgi:hypothetical protein
VHEESEQSTGARVLAGPSHTWSLGLEYLELERRAAGGRDSSLSSQLIGVAQQGLDRRWSQGEDWQVQESWGIAGPAGVSSNLAAYSEVLTEVKVPFHLR